MSNTSYQAQRDQAEDDGTALPERTDDLPPADLWHTARDLAQVIGSALSTQAEQIGVPDDFNRWERLDVGRAAAYVRHHQPEAFAVLQKAHPWLADYADETGEGAEGALASQF